MADHCSYLQGYAKNWRLLMGRWPVRLIFEQALELFREKQRLFGFMEDKIMPLSNVAEGYGIFDRKEVQKNFFGCAGVAMAILSDTSKIMNRTRYLTHHTLSITQL